jgi:hypothetical protein
VIFLVPPGARAGAATVADLSWLAGRWAGELHGRAIEEIWSAPSGDSLVGVFRVVKDGKARLYEILVVEQEEKGPVLRIRHFDRRLIAREEKDKPVTMPLVGHKDGEAVFQDPESGTRIVYRRDGDSLVAALEKTRDGKRTVTEFRYTRR